MKVGRRILFHTTHILNELSGMNQHHTQAALSREVPLALAAQHSQGAAERSNGKCPGQYGKP